jgi:photosystem II stability/assembly factor-like uncharacterized protein
MVKTTNAGSNWYLLTTGELTSILLSVDFTNINTGYSVGYSGPYGICIETTNAGLDWFELSLSCLEQWHIWNSVTFVNNNTGYVLGTCLNKTTNSGTNWSNLMYTSGGMSQSFPDINTGYIVGGYDTAGYKISKTTNGGNNWFIQLSGMTKSLRSVYFVNQTTGWAVGDSGIILKTTDGGGPIGIIPISNKIPDRFQLYQNYPNPFNPSTTIKFDIPTPLNPPFRKGGTSESVKLVVYDVLGREAATLVNEQLKPGSYEVEWNGSNYTSGVYFYKLMAGDYMETKKMVLVK